MVIETDRRIGTHLRNPEHTISPELKDQVAGVVIIITALPRDGSSNPLVYTVREKESKPQTDKIAGQISFVAETRKDGEQPFPNLLGALAEFSGDDEILKNHLYISPGISYRESAVFIRDGLIPVDLAFLYYDGPLNGEVNPTENVEVERFGWKTIQEIRGVPKEGLRNIVNQALDVEEKEGIIESITNGVVKIPLSQILPENFSVAAFNTQREQLKDKKF